MFFAYSIANQHRFLRRFMAELPGDSSAPQGYDAGHARDLSQSPRIGMSSMGGNGSKSVKRWGLMSPLERMKHGHHFIEAPHQEGTQHQTDWKLLNLGAENLVSKFPYMLLSCQLASPIFGASQITLPFNTKPQTQPLAYIKNGHLKLYTPYLASTHHPSRWGMQSLQEDIPLTILISCCFPYTTSFMNISHESESFKTSSPQH